MGILQKIANSKISQKIGYGYTLTLGVAAIGAILGLATGEYYQTKAIQKLILVDHKRHIIYKLENYALSLRLHPQKLISVVENSIWFQYEKDKYNANIERLDRILSDLKTILKDNPQYLLDIEDYQNLVQEYEQTVLEHSELINFLWLEVENLNSNSTSTNSSKEIIIEVVNSDQAISTEIKFERLLEKLIAVSNLVENQSKRATNQLVQARLLKRKIILTSTLLSIAVAFLLAQYTSKAIASPLEQVTLVAEKVTLESDFNIQANIKTKDEIGSLAEAFNHLITQVKDLLAAREAEVINQKKQQIELKKAKEAADIANLAKSKFLTNMSHELRTPLNGILGYAEILKRNKTLSPQQEKGLQIIHDSGNHLLTIINDILDISSIETGKLKLYPEKIFFVDFLEKIIAFFSLSAEQKENIISLELSEDIPKIIKADAKRLRQVLINLIGNALKFTSQGRVTLKVTVISQKKKFT